MHNCQRLSATLGDVSNLRGLLPSIEVELHRRFDDEGQINEGNGNRARAGDLMTLSLRGKIWERDTDHSQEASRIKADQRRARGMTTVMTQGMAYSPGGRRNGRVLAGETRKNDEMGEIGQLGKV